jgi:transcriptional regulator with XRE-family HTH domain
MPRCPSIVTESERRAFGEVLRLMRQDLPKSKRQVGIALAGKNVDKADANRTRISKYESGAIHPTVETTCKLAAIYGISTLRLLRMAGYAVELLRPIVRLLGTGRRRNIPAFCQAGVSFALLAFPRRSDTPNLWDSSEAKLDKAFSEIIRFDLPRGKLPHVMAQAEAVLLDSAVPSDARRNIAAEYVHVYVCAIEPELYETALRNIYSQEKTV